MGRLLLATCFVLIPSCVIVVGDGFRTRHGSGHRVKEARSCPTFHAIQFHGAGELEVNVGSEPGVLLSGDHDLLPGVRTEVEDGVLSIRYPNDYDFDESLCVSIGLSSLDGLQIYGSADARIEGVHGELLQLEISGSGNICARGTAEHLEVLISGSGDLDLEALDTQEASIRISGSGEAQLNVARDLHYHISGSGDIEYIGQAKAAGVISGSGSIVRVD